MSLAKIEPQSRVVLDTGVLLRALIAGSPQCEALLLRCQKGELQGLVPAPVFCELSHRLMIYEARLQGKASGSNPAKWLAQRPQEVAALGGSRSALRKLLQSSLRFESVLSQDMAEALSLQERFGLLSSDSLVAAAALRLEADAIATTDKAFARLGTPKAFVADDIR